MHSRLSALDPPLSRAARRIRWTAAVFALLGSALGPWVAGCESDTTSYVPSAGGDATVADGPHAESAADAVSDAPRETTGDAADAPMEATPTDAGAHPVEGSVEATSGDAPSSADATLSDAPLDAPRSAALAAVRVANWTPDAPALDFCLAAHGTGVFQGPMLSNQGDSGVVGLALTQDCATPALALTAAACPVSAYFLVKAQSYDLRFVAPSADCSVPVFPDSTTLAPLNGGSSVTLALVGKLHPSGSSGSEPGLKVVQLVDDSVASPAGVPLRFVHAAPSLAALKVSLSVDIAMAGPQVLFSGLAFGQQSAQALAGADGGRPATDTNGYAALPSLAGAVFSAQTLGAASDSSAPPAATSSPTSVAGGSSVTLTLVSGPSAPQLWECIDNAGTSGAYSNCFALSP